VREQAPFLADDLAELDEALLSRASGVISMREVYEGNRNPNFIGLRHDMDNFLRGSVELAEWEAERGYRSTFFVLHDSPYWDDLALPVALEHIAGLDHEIGLHANGIAEALKGGGDPDEVLFSALERLRGWGHNVFGVVAHGDPLCYEYGFVNDEQFTECARPEMGDPDRWLSDVVQLRPRPLSDFGLEYESYRLGRALYLSDSGGSWTPDFSEIVEQFPTLRGQLHILQHPCWWPAAFPTLVEAA
jgi:hypothetical protein